MNLIHGLILVYVSSQNTLLYMTYTPIVTESPKKTMFYMGYYFIVEHYFIDQLMWYLKY